MSERSEIAALGAIVAALAIVALGQQGLRPHAIAPSASASGSTRSAHRGPAPVQALVALRDGKTIDLNCADAAALELLPGVGPALARRIVEHRAAAGPFRSIDALDAVRGVGPKKLAAMRPLLSVSASVGASVGASTCPASTTPTR